MHGASSEHGPKRNFIGLLFAPHDAQVLWRAEGAAGSLPALAALLSEEVLVGSGQLCQAELRPLAFSMLAELVHHARGNLSADQMNHTVRLFCRCAAPPVRTPSWLALVLTVS